MQSQPMGCPGEDIKLSEAASKVFPFSVECKNQEKLNIWKALEQSDQENRGLPSMVIFKRNRSKVYVAMELADLLKILEENQ